MVGIAIDARYHGDRNGGAKGASAYVAAITKAWKAEAGKPTEHPFYYDTVWDLWRLLDVMAKDDAIDAGRIGMMGISMGGIETWLAASVDDRVAVAAPLIGVQSFRWSLENDKWQGRANTIKAAHEAAAKDFGEPAVNGRVCRELWGKVIPGILDDFDCPNLLPPVRRPAAVHRQRRQGPELPGRGGEGRLRRGRGGVRQGRRQGEVGRPPQRRGRPQGDGRGPEGSRRLRPEVAEAVSDGHPGGRSGGDATFLPSASRVGAAPV